jgi:hypothetical protein
MKAGNDETGNATYRSIRNWVSCSGNSDDTVAVQRAFAESRHGAFTLLIDCPVRIHSGLDIERVIYIDDGTTVEFRGSGKFTVDNVMHPAFVLANVSGVTLTNWNVEYDASLPVDPDVHGYGHNGQFVAVAGHSQPSPAWNDLAMTSWLTANRSIVFDRSNGNVRSRWIGLTNACAVFFINGDTSNVKVTGMNVHVPTSAGADRFVPVVFQFSPNFKSNQTVTAKTPINGQFFAVPHDLVFSDVTLDGTYMGWVGGAQNVVFDHIRSHRYADLQDANGGNVGGVGKWFAPPHLFYIVYDNTLDPALFSNRIRIHDVVDDGPRIGAARDKGAGDTISGYAPSIKIGCNDCSVDAYKTTRPDGFLDVLFADGLRISNVNATFDSSFLNNLYPGWRFPSSPYANVTFENISLTDSAATTIYPPISDAPLASNRGILFRNVRVTLNRWAGTRPLVANITGEGSHVVLDYTILDTASRVMSVQNGAVSLRLEATPSRLSQAGSTDLTWTSKDASQCQANGSWAGPLGNQGTRTISVTGAGSHAFGVHCDTPGGALEIGLPVVVGP